MNRKDTAFTVELLGLFILLTAVITIVSGVFVMSRSHSLEAKQLNDAVILAQNTAEISSAAPDDGRLLDMLYSMDNNTGHKVVSRESDEAPGSWNVLFASVKRNDPSKDDELYIISVTRSYPLGTPEERSDGGSYAEDLIEVYALGDIDPDDAGALMPNDLGDPIYTLTAGTYFEPDSYGEKGGRS